MKFGSFSKLTGIKTPKIGVSKRTFTGNCLDWGLDAPALPKRKRGRRRKWYAG